MRTPRLLCFGLLLLAGTGAIAAGADLPPPRQPGELRSEPDDSEYGQFDGHGKLLFQSLTTDDGLAWWHGTLIYYPYRNSVGLQLHRDVSAMDVFLAAEVRRPRTVRAFLNGYLAHFLYDNFGEIPTRPIIRTEVAREIDDYLAEKDCGSISTARQAQLKVKLLGYARSGEPVVTGNSWTFDVNVITDAGAVEHWLIKGQVTPLQIVSYLCEPKEPAGSFQPLMWIR